MFSRLQKYLLNRSTYQDKISLGNNKIYILPTKSGLFFALILLLMLLTAINFGNSLIYFLTFFLASISIVSMLFTQKSLLGLSFQTGIATPVFCNQSARVPLICTLPEQYQSLPAAITIKLDNSKGRGSAKDLKFNQTIDLTEQQQSILLSVKTWQRGYVKVPPITISTTFPFGLFYAWSIIKLNNQSLVYPQPIKTDDAILSNQPNDNSSDSEQLKGIEDFSGLDKFIKGQSLKQVHWKTYAKQQGLYIKTFSGGSKTDKYWFDIEQFDSSISLETRLGYISSLILQADKKGDSYGLKLHQQTIAMGVGDLHKQKCLKALALFNLNNSGAEVSN